MIQTFGIHIINGLPDTFPTKDLYNTPSIENSYDSITQIEEQSRSSVYIASDPSGAQIFIDGIEQTGFKTPAMLTEIPKGHHNFKLSSSGYVDIESSIPLDSGRTYNIFLTMGKSTLTQSYTDSSGLVILLALGLIGYFLIRNK